MPSPTSLAPVLSPEAWELLNSLPEYDDAASSSLNLRLRKDGWPPEVVAAVLTQLRLRRAARGKFGEFAERMLLTDHGLQQSTRLPVAARHARRFVSAAVEHVVDLGCGLGGDALAMASAGLQVTAVEADETTAAAATINLRAFPEASVVHSRAEEYTAGLDWFARPPAEGPDMPPRWTGPGLWLDPARRDERSRIWDPEAFSPPLSFVTELAATGAPMGVKLGPGMPHELIPADCEAEWVSIDGELVEVVLWFNALARPGVRRAATVLTSSREDPLRVTAAELTSSDDFGQGLHPDPAGSAGLRGVLHEPDPAVIRAGLVAELCAQLEGRMLDEHIAYLCTDDAPSPAHPPFSRAYRVLEVMDFNPKRLKRWLQDQEVTSLEIKKRGVDVVPETLRRQLLGSPKKPRAGSPKKHATLVLTRVGDERLAAVVEPLR
ncbi:THUMP-like domain-containing protein [Nesterenkonia flava]|uniref:SAM-dependent methyltransferase n=1 Tax=Nesterenkonia flava TaxID=469799 RepID=A0ABU1FRW5_9MICC|nr:SAM-dependent methyltransferase [Nesterenkonia flava]MDR5710891.1 SAM-dependent methyltransferase [Nesterenkonia flava]